MAENRDDRSWGPSDQQSSITHPSTNPSQSSRTRSTSPSTRSGNHENEIGSIELQETPQRSLSVGHREHTTVSREEVESWSSPRSSLVIQPERHHVGSLLRRSLLQRNPRSESSAKNVQPESVSPSTLRISRASSFGFQRPESPYRGATGPSQPYGMYTQDTSFSRTPSTATASFVQRPERTYSGPSGPTQPYSLYPQNTVEEDGQTSFGSSVPPAPLNYPAGARPAPQAHQRRLGPDGEDLDDLIGPYGYAEQLPPYSRYPNDIPPKRDPDASSFVNGEASSSVHPTHSPQSPIQSTSPLTTATYVPTSEPTPYSETSLHNTTSRQLDPSHENTANIPNLASPTHQEIRPPTNSSAAPAPEVTSPHTNPFSDTSTQGSSTAVGSSTASEKGSLKNRIRDRAKKRVCCGMVPCWLIVFAAALIVAVCIGGILGGVLAHDTNVQTSKSIGGGPKPAEVQPTVTVTSIIPAQTPDDVDPINTASGLPAIPTGSFTVTLDEPSTTSNSCLTDALQNNAWDCSTGANLNVTIAMQGNAPYISLTYPTKPGQIQYGAQPPQLSGPSSLLYIRDKSSLGSRWGNSYGFKQPFNKTVIVRSQDFPGSMAKRSLRWAFRRWLNHEYDDSANAGILSSRQVQQSDWNMTSLASATDKPWLCTWNGTFLTGFIYVSTSVTQQLQYPKSMKILEKRPMTDPPPATCQQMMVQRDFSLTPLKFSDGSYNIVVLDEQAATSDDPDEDDNAPGAANGSKAKRQISGQIGGPRCECAWQST